MATGIYIRVKKMGPKSASRIQAPGRLEGWYLFEFLPPTSDPILSHLSNLARKIIVILITIVTEVLFSNSLIISRLAELPSARVRLHIAELP